MGPVCELPAAQTKFATPRIEAGESIATDIEKCHLEALRRTDLYPQSVTDQEWAQLKRTFSSGVCDYTDPGVDQRGTIPWQSYQADAAGRHVIYGGKPLGRAPSGSGGGWTSQSFSWWLER